MKRLLSLFCAVAFILLLAPFSSAQTAPEVSAKSAVLLEAESGKVLFSKDSGRQMSMASTTKIMTSLLAIEHGDLDAEITVQDEWVRVEGSAIGLAAGDKVTLEGLVCGMLMASGNDAANVTAYALGGSLEGFADMMNARAKEIGMEHTHFVTPSGLDDDDHYTTAYDMALLGVEAIKNETFLSCCSAEGMYASFGNPPTRRYFANHNQLLQKYDDAIGIKTGFTKKSGRCLVSAAERDGVTLVAVTLDAPDDWMDHIKLFDYGFSLVTRVVLDTSFEGIYIDVTGGSSDSVRVKSDESPHVNVTGETEPRVERRIYLKRFEFAPLPPSVQVGEALYYINGELVYRLKLYPEREIPTDPDIKSDSERFREALRNIAYTMFDRV